MVWTEDAFGSPSTRFAVVVSFQERLGFVALVYSIEQLQQLARRFYPQHVQQVVGAVQATARLPGRTSHSTIVLTDRPLVDDLVQGMVMSQDLPLPAGE